MWSVVSGASRYELQDRTDGPGGEWTRVGTTTSATLAYSPAGGPECDTTYDFRVRSYGDAATYAAGWSVESGLESVTTESCNRAPEFATSTYSFMVAEDAAATDTVGTVSAIDPDSDPVSYAITGGNASGKFEMSTSTGAITVAGALDHETAPMYTLTVEARDDGDGVGTATVEIAVTDVPEDTPPAPGGLGVSLTNDMFTVTCSTVAGAAVYELQQQVSGSGAGWALVATTTGLSTTYSPTGGTECGTTYEFRVRSLPRPSPIVPTPRPLRIGGFGLRDADRRRFPLRPPLGGSPNQPTSMPRDPRPPASVTTATSRSIRPSRHGCRSQN